MAAGPITYIGANLGAKAVRKAIAFEKKTRAYRDAAIKVAEQRGREAIKTAGRVGKQHIERSKILAAKTVSQAKMAGNRAVGAARRTMVSAMAPVNAELTSAKRAYEGSRNLFTRRLQKEVSKFPFVNPMNGGVPFTAEQAANAASGGRWSRPWKVAADYRASQVKPALQNLGNRLRPFVDRAANRLMGAENMAMYANRHYGKELAKAVSDRAINIAGAEAQAATIRKLAAEGAMKRSSVVARAAQKAVADAGTVTGVRAAALAVGDAARSTGTAISGAAGKLAAFNAKYTPINVSGILRKVGTTAMDSNFSPVKWVSKLGSKVVAAPGRLAGAVAAPNVAGRLLRTVAGTAKTNAIGFAVGSWIDAGLNAYDYFSDSSNRGVSPGEITINGKTAKLHEPGIVDSVLSKKYLAEVGKGFGRALTLGFWGSDDNTVLDRWAEGNPAAEAAKLNEYIDAGRDPYTGKILTDSDGKALVTDPGKNERILKQAKDLQKDNAERLSAGSRTDFKYGFRHYLGSLVAEKNAKLQMVENNVANWGQFSRTLRGPAQTPEQYRETATKNFTKRYDGYIEAALSNPMAKTVAESNRSQAYRLYTGRDYERDYALEGAKAGSVEGFKEFNDDWNGLDDLQRATWDYTAEKKAYDAAVAAPAEEDK